MFRSSVTAGMAPTVASLIFVPGRHEHVLLVQNSEVTAVCNRRAGTLAGICTHSPANPHSRAPLVNKLATKRTRPLKRLKL